jgi:hypothetical protein
MNVAIISKVEHAQPHAEAVRRLGHEVDIIDPYVARKMPETYDIYVCRVESVSHSAFDLLNEWRRNGKNVVFENSKTKIVQAIEKFGPPVEEIMTLTRQEKLKLAVSATGIYSPRVVFDEVNLAALYGLGFAQPGQSKTQYIREALEATAAFAAVGERSQGGPWSELLADPTANVTRFYRRTRTGKATVKMVSRRPLRDRTATSVAVILGLERHQGELEQDEVPGSVIEQELPPEPEAQIEANVPVEPVEVQPDAEVVPPPGAAVAPKPANAKADLKEILTMLNEALLALNIADMTVVPSENGPQIQMSQIVIRRITSIEGLE